ncbi:hypothetical protein, partial [Acetobacter fabarum]|uniref:hypothetical protein n=1 Tax=Acetobacter fabarum TaxID=483199 RepID=UPI000BFADF24
QPGKPLFNVKKSRLLHDPYSNQRKENGITEQTSIPEGFSNPPCSYRYNFLEENFSEIDI